MLWTICQRELLDHLKSVRFALTLALTVLLLAVNAALFAGGPFQQRLNDYIEQRQSAIDNLQSRAEDLGNLYVRGLGVLHKQPSPLVFCASGRDEYLPQTVYATSNSSYSSGWGLTLRNPWHLRYSTPGTPPAAAVVSDFVEIDWVFIIGFALSLLALLLTFDAVCGERQDGTLILLLSNPVSRTAVLGGKLLAALAVLGLALALGLGINLLIASLFGPLSLDAATGLKLAAMGLAALLYLAFFAALGLLVSTLFDRPAASLVTLLLIWTLLLVILPNTTAGIVGSLTPVSPPERQDIFSELRDKYGIADLKHSDEDGDFDRDYLKTFADLVAEWYDRSHQQAEETLRAQLAQVETGRNLHRLTPYGAFQFALESLAGTGLSRHYRFIEDARRYAAEFRDLARQRDAGDPDSFHLIGIAEGMSRKAIPPEAIPIFKEDLSARATVAATATEFLLLGLFALVALLAAHLAFLRGEVR